MSKFALVLAVLCLGCAACNTGTQTQPTIPPASSESVPSYSVPEPEIAEDSSEPQDQVASVESTSLTRETPRGTRVVLVDDAFAARGKSDLEDVYSYAEQGDDAAIAEMLEEPLAMAFFYPTGTQLVFEGCYFDDCEFVELRLPGNNDKRVFYANEVTLQEAESIAATNEVSEITSSETLSSSFTEETPRGTEVVLVKDAFAARATGELEDIHSYADQGDEAAIAEMLEEPFAEAFFYPAGTQLVFEGCYFGDCAIVELRESGSDKQRIFYATDVAVK